VQKRKPPSTAKDNAPVRMVKITGLTPDISTTLIEMFIENKSGGSELESCDFDADIGVAVVGFKSPKGSINLPSSKKNVCVATEEEYMRTDTIISEVTRTDGKCKKQIKFDSR